MQGEKKNKHMQIPPQQNFIHFMKPWISLKKAAGYNFLLHPCAGAPLFPLVTPAL